MSSLVTTIAQPDQGDPQSARDDRPKSRQMDRTKRLVVFSLVALALIATTAILLATPTETVPMPLAQPLYDLPTALGEWHGSPLAPADVVPVDPDVKNHFLRTYQKGADTVWLSVGYYPTLTAGHHPQAQRLLFPGKGYTELITSATTIPLAAGAPPLSANLFLMRMSERDLSIVYWYQLGRRSVASDHGYRALLLLNRLWFRRSDVALVRVTSPVLKDGDPAPVVATQMDFIRALYPELLRSLPE